MHIEVTAEDIRKITMLAFKEAEKTGCYGIELDVQLTKGR